MKVLSILILAMLFSLGCARVQVHAPKEPIKVDISMRLDIYQHIEKDIDAIENIVSGSGSKAKDQPSGKQSLLDYIFKNAYAQEGLSPEVEQAALRRRDRKAQLSQWQAKGVIGENQAGLVEIRSAAAANPALEALVKAEDEDRMIIYRSIAKKNNSSLEEVQKIYAQRLRNDAPSGTPIEAPDDATGIMAWKIK